MNLYYAPGACSLAPHIVGLEAGVPLNLVKVDLAAKKIADGGDFYAVNPKGYVPAIRLDDGNVLTEAANIVAYLAAGSRKPGWRPRQGPPSATSSRNGSPSCRRNCTRALDLCSTRSSPMTPSRC